MNSDRDHSTGQLPDLVKEFLVRQIDSVAELEGLLLIRADPTVAWDAPALARALYIEISMAARVIGALRERGFLGQDEAGDFRYAALPDLDAQLAEVAAAYRRYLIPITHIIHDKARSSTQQFADAFRLRDKKP